MTNFESALETLVENAVSRALTRSIDSLKSEMMDGFAEQIKTSLSLSLNQPMPAPEEEKFLTAKEVKQMLKIAHSTLWAMHQDGRLVPLKIGRKSLYREVDVKSFLRC